MLITEALSKDLEDILKLQKLAFKAQAEIYNDFKIPPLTQTLDELKEEYAEKLFLKAVIDNKIVGSVRGYQRGKTCYIGRLIVHPDYQNQGIGTKLMQEIERCFKSADRFELFTGYKSYKNLYLYQKLGYTTFKTKTIKQNLIIVYLEKRPGG